MAEFDNPTALVDAADEGAPRGLPQDGRLLADSDRGAERGARPAPHAAAAAGAARRHPRRARRLQPRVLGVGDRLPDEHRRPAAQQLAAVHPGDVRDDGARRGADRVHRHVGAEQAAAAVSPGVQRAGVRRAHRRDRFFLVHRGDGSALRSRTRRGSFSRACIQ